MATDYHSAIATGAAANAATFNTPLGLIDAAIGLLGGGASVTDEGLIGWTEGGLYELTSITRDADNVPTTATAKWPDGSAGVFTVTSKNATWLAIDAYTITHVNGSKTVTQAAVTRNASGAITTKPALTVA